MSASKSLSSFNMKLSFIYVFTVSIFYSGLKQIELFNNKLFTFLQLSYLFNNPIDSGAIQLSSSTIDSALSKSTMS